MRTCVNTSVSIPDRNLTRVLAAQQAFYYLPERSGDRRDLNPRFPLFSIAHSICRASLSRSPIYGREPTGRRFCEVRVSQQLTRARPAIRLSGKLERGRCEIFLGVVLIVGNMMSDRPIIITLG